MKEEPPLKKELTSLLFAALMIIGLATPASAQLFGESTPGNTNNTIVQADDCDTDPTDGLTCEAAYFMDKSAPAALGVMRMGLGPEIAGAELYFFDLLVGEISRDPLYTDVTRNVDWDFLDDYDNFVAFEVESTDPTVPGMTMLMVLDGNDVYIFIFMEVDSVTAHDYTRDMLEAGEFIAPPASFEQIEPEDAPDVSFV